MADFLRRIHDSALPNDWSGIHDVIQRGWCDAAANTQAGLSAENSEAQYAHAIVLHPPGGCIGRGPMRPGSQAVGVVAFQNKSSRQP